MEAKKHVALMGTVIELQVAHPKADSLLQETVRRLEDYEHRFSANKKDSMLGQVNQAAGKHPVQVDEDLFDLIALAKEVSLSTHLAFNLAIGPLVQLWRIGFEDAHVPDPKDIQYQIQKVDPKAVLLREEEHQVYLKKEGMAIDLGAIAKGYFADQIIAFWKGQGAMYGLINLGGNVRVIGDSPKSEDGSWQIGIQKPGQRRGELIGKVRVKDKSVVTSGIYERKLCVQGRTYHHIFDSKTGYPLTSDMTSLTVISDRSVNGEIWTTALFHYSAKEAIFRLDKQEGLEGLAINQTGEIFFSKGLRGNE